MIFRALAPLSRAMIRSRDAREVRIFFLLDGAVGDLSTLGARRRPKATRRARDAGEEGARMKSEVF
jgi:hypothetical protein